MVPIATVALTPATTADGDAWILLGQDRPGVTVSPLLTQITERVPGLPR